MEFYHLLTQIETADNRIDALKALKQPADDAYAERYKLVCQAFGLAAGLGYKVGVRVDTKEWDWPIFCIMLPHVGEISWHMPAHQVPYFGYDAKEKYERIHKYLQTHLAGLIQK